MAAKRKVPTKRSHARSAANTQTSISMRSEIIELGKQMADSDLRSFSNWLASLIAAEAERRGHSNGGVKEREK